MIPDAAGKNFASDLLAWYKEFKRSLPWRDHQEDAYAVWISEIMLQQTTVSAVIGFYLRWMERFPTMQSLAEAPLDDVLKHWAGLGYYARARNLKKAAGEVMNRFGGTLPVSVNELMTLPGVGRYTAGAISSIAYQQDAAIVDANVVRVLCRLYALRGDPKVFAALQRQLWHLAESTIPSGEARDYNQALMELGALVCLPASPRCASCPVFSYCDAGKSGDPGQFPEFSQAVKWVEVNQAACIVRNENRLLIVQRPLEELWGGLWELPRVLVGADEAISDAAMRAVRETVGITVSNPVFAARIKHVVTHRKVTLHGYLADWDTTSQPQKIACRDFAWVAEDDLNSYAISSPQISLMKEYRARRMQPALLL